MYGETSTTELLTRAIKVCDIACDHVKTYKCCGKCHADIIDLAKSCKDVLDVFQLVIEVSSKDDSAVISVARKLAKSQFVIRELEKRLKVHQNYKQKWSGAKLLLKIRRKELPDLRPNLQRLREHLGSVKKTTTIKIKKCEKRTMQTTLDDEADEADSPPSYTESEKQQSAQPPYRSCHKMTNAANLILRETDMSDEEYNGMACPWGIRYFEERFPARTCWLLCPVNYRLRAAPRVPLYVAIPVDVDHYFRPW